MTEHKYKSLYDRICEAQKRKAIKKNKEEQGLIPSFVKIDDEYIDPEDIDFDFK